jgi:hypothetical protein
MFRGGCRELCEMRVATKMRTQIKRESVCVCVCVMSEESWSAAQYESVSTFSLNEVESKKHIKHIKKENETV